MSQNIMLYVTEQAVLQALSGLFDKKTKPCFGNNAFGKLWIQVLFTDCPADDGGKVSESGLVESGMVED